MDAAVKLALELGSLIEQMKSDDLPIAKITQFGQLIVDHWKNLQKVVNEQAAATKAITETSQAMADTRKSMEVALDAFGTPTKDELESKIRELEGSLKNLIATISTDAIDRNRLKQLESNVQTEQRKLNDLQDDKKRLEKDVADALEELKDLRKEKDAAVREKNSANDAKAELQKFKENAIKSKDSTQRSHAEEIKTLKDTAAKAKETAERNYAEEMRILKEGAERAERNHAEEMRILKDGAERAKEKAQRTHDDVLRDEKEEAEKAAQSTDMEHQQELSELRNQLSNALGTSTKTAEELDAMTAQKDELDRKVRRMERIQDDLDERLTNANNLMDQHLDTKFDDLEKAVRQDINNIGTDTVHDALQQWLGPMPAKAPKKAFVNVFSQDMTTLTSALNSASLTAQPIQSLAAAYTQLTSGASPNQTNFENSDDHERPRTSESSTLLRPAAKKARTNEDGAEVADDEDDSREEMLDDDFNSSAFPGTTTGGGHSSGVGASRLFGDTQGRGALVLSNTGSGTDFSFGRGNTGFSSGPQNTFGRGTRGLFSSPQNPSGHGMFGYSSPFIAGGGGIGSYSRFPPRRTGEPPASSSPFQSYLGFDVTNPSGASRPQIGTHGSHQAAAPTSAAPANAGAAASGSSSTAQVNPAATALGGAPATQASINAAASGSSSAIQTNPAVTALGGASASTAQAGANLPLRIPVPTEYRVRNSVLDTVAKGLLVRGKTEGDRKRWVNKANSIPATSLLHGCYPVIEKDKTSHNAVPHDRQHRCSACTRAGRQCFILEDKDTVLLMEPSQAQRLEQAQYDTAASAVGR